MDRPEFANCRLEEALKRARADNSRQDACTQLPILQFAGWASGCGGALSAKWGRVKRNSMLQQQRFTLSHRPGEAAEPSRACVGGELIDPLE